jgi:hypothetical protein
MQGGALVPVSDKRIAVVRHVHEQDIVSPTVEIIAPENQGQMIDLVKQREVRITGPLNPHREGRPFLPLVGTPA